MKKNKANDELLAVIDDELLAVMDNEIREFANVIARPDPDVWFIELSESDQNLLGFISCEENKEDIEVPTITMSLKLYDITDVPKQGILELFNLNGDLHACTLSAENLEGRWILFLNRRIMVSSYQPGELYGNIYLMIDRFSVFMEEIEGIIVGK